MYNNKKNVQNIYKIDLSLYIYKTFGMYMLMQSFINIG